MDKLKDSEVIARLIYKAFLAPDLEPGGEDALVTFPMALDLHARIKMQELGAERAQEELLRIKETPAMLRPKETEPPRGEPQSPPDDPAPPEAPVLSEPPRQITGHNKDEKREIYAKLMQFCAEHGLGARRKIADVSNGALTLSDVQDLTDCVPRPINVWRICEAAMNYIENQEKEKT